MANKTKQKSTAEQALNDATATLGILLMTAATTLGLVEIPHEEKRAIVPSQPAYAFAGEAEQGNGLNQIRRERDEIHPHQVGYGISQRTTARAGRL